MTLSIFITVLCICCDSFCAQWQSSTTKKCSSSKQLRSYRSTTMMLPGQYRFTLQTTQNKRSNSPLEAGSSRTDLIQAEGSGSPCRIKVIGVGGGGGNAVNRMIESSTGVAGVELWVVNTDAQALSRSLAPRKLNIGNLTSRYYLLSCFVAIYIQLLWCFAVRGDI